MTLFLPIAWALLWVALGGPTAVAQDTRGDSARRATRRVPAERESPHFTLHTDLEPQRADAMLDRMEATLAFAAQCWGRPPRGRIECYVVDDLRNWPDFALPHPLTKVVVSGIGGATLNRVIGKGKSARNAALVIASAAPGVAEHEVIHAYCAQNFGGMGPNWYKEGMAEMAILGHGCREGVRCSSEPLDLLRHSPAHSIHDILITGQAADRITNSLDTMLARRGDSGRHVPAEAWTGADAANALQARREHLWNWALCYLLRNNPNYAERFQVLGHDLLTKRNTSFEQCFAHLEPEIMFEYAFFLQRIDVGYRVDLCRWDWNKPNRGSLDGGAVATRCAAARGWQASDALVTEGRTYRYEATGSWSAAAHLGDTDADGHSDGSGKLTAIVMRDYQLSAPVELGSRGSFVAPMTGRLHLRCEDAWNCLSDNRGELLVRITSEPLATAETATSD